MSQNLAEIQTFINFNDDLFKFGGETTLTKYQLKVETGMMELQKLFSQLQKDVPRADSKQWKDKRDHMTNKLEKRLKELNSTKYWTFGVFGVLSILVIGMVIWQCCATKNAFAGDMANTGNMLKIQKENFEKQIKQVEKMKKVLEKKMKELGLEKELSEILDEGQDESSSEDEQIDNGSDDEESSREEVVYKRGEKEKED